MKKGMSANVGYWFFRILIVLPIILFVLSQITSLASDQATTSRNIGSPIIENRIYQTLGYIDPNTGRLYPEIIDLTKFNEEYLANNILSDSALGLKLKINNQELFYDKEFYIIADQQPRKYNKITITRPITTIENNIKKQAHIKLDILTKNE